MTYSSKSHLRNWTRSQPLCILEKRKTFFHLPLSQQWFLPFSFALFIIILFLFFILPQLPLSCTERDQTKKMRIHTKICGWRNYQQVQTIQFSISFHWAKTILFSHSKIFPYFLQSSLHMQRNKKNKVFTRRCFIQNTHNLKCFQQLFQIYFKSAIQNDIWWAVFKAH